MPTDPELTRYERMLTSLLRDALAQPTRPDVMVAYAHAVLAVDTHSLPATGSLLPVPSPLLPNQDTGGPAAGGTRSERDIHQLLEGYAAGRVGTPVYRPVAEHAILPPTRAANGADWIAIAWRALGNTVGPTPRDVFQGLSAAQQPAGHFLHPSANDNLESWWYAELVLLHAVGTYAVDANDPTAFAAAERAAAYHLGETQPDHATSEPWAIFPFLLQAHTRSLADQLLHNAHMVPPTGTSLLLLADALYCLRTFNKPGAAA